MTNTGNGPETFRLVMNSVIGGDEFDPTPSSPSIYLDTDASGDLSAGDTAYVVGNNDPVLAADAFVTVLVINDIPARSSMRTAVSRACSPTRARAPARRARRSRARARPARTRSSARPAPTATRQAQYLVAGVTVNAVKTQAVVDQFGGARPVPGARINYSIVVERHGLGLGTASVFNDNVPANTTYVPGTLRLNGTLLIDGVDADAGVYEAAPTARVRVTLGTLTQASGSQTITFAVTIN